MTLARFTFIFSVVAILLIPRLVFAGTLDDAPFRVVVPDSEWQIADSTAQSMGKDVFLAATISNTNTRLKSVVIKTALKKTTDSSLDELCAGIRDSFANPAVKKISEGDTTFLGYKAKIFTYQVTQGGQATYNEATVFVAGGRGWTIACVGRPDQKDEIKKIIGFYQKREANHTLQRPAGAS
jgi:hypothetical protein